MSKPTDEATHENGKGRCRLVNLTGHPIPFADFTIPADLHQSDEPPNPAAKMYAMMESGSQSTLDIISVMAGLPDHFVRPTLPPAETGDNGEPATMYIVSPEVAHAMSGRRVDLVCPVGLHPGPGGLCYKALARFMPYDPTCETSEIVSDEMAEKFVDEARKAILGDAPRQSARDALIEVTEQLKKALEEAGIKADVEAVVADTAKDVGIGDDGGSGEKLGGDNPEASTAI